MKRELWCEEPGERVAAVNAPCQERVNKLAGNRPLPERPCSLSGRFAGRFPDHDRDAVQRSPELEFQERSEAEAEVRALGEAGEQGVRVPAEIASDRGSFRSIHSPSGIPVS
ncbi:hypothetical protein ACF05T_15335 [Streptomyces lateritius]|uniref:Uncharacterized protein n=1 Tax=Streptomyces lateritius TaxID=67313 RepID=A0ABW6YCW4_9ACTN